MRGGGFAGVLGIVAIVMAATFVMSSTTATRRHVQAQERRDWVHQRFLDIEGYDGVAQRVVVTYPRRSDGRSRPPGERYPVVIALHGRGEARLAPNRGALAWYLQYKLPEAFGALGRRRLTSADYHGLVNRGHLEMVNAQLRAEPFRGVAVVTPYTPDLMGDPQAGPRVAAFGDWLAGPLLSALRDEFPNLARGRDATGIDGVSLGGMLSLEAGFAHPEAFGAVGAIQPAIRGRESRLVAAATRARDHNQGPQQVRLLTSEADPFREPTESLSTALRAVHLSHRLLVVPGPHDYQFNQGPGAIELLRYFDEVLAREPVGGR
ncbi:MAG: esterase [Deltaproteobacteria bacterium]|nr:MAG: esterase [Deltaproteobacteria bacterium]